MATQKNSYGWTTPATSSQNTGQLQQRSDADQSSMERYRQAQQMNERRASQFEQAQQRRESPQAPPPPQPGSFAATRNMNLTPEAERQMAQMTANNQLATNGDARGFDQAVNQAYQQRQAVNQINNLKNQGQPTRLTRDWRPGDSGPTSQIQSLPTAQTSSYTPNPNNPFYNQPQPSPPPGYGGGGGYNFQAPGFQGGGGAPPINMGGGGGGGSFTPTPFTPGPVNQQFNNTQGFATPQAGFTPGQTQPAANPLANTGQNLFNTFQPDAFADKGMRDMNKSFLENSAIPLLTHNLNQQTQDFNQFANMRDFNQQTINDAFDRQLASNKFGLDTAAFNFSQEQFAAEFPEMIRQFNVNTQLEQRQQDLTNQFNMGMLSKEQFEAETARARQQAEAEIGMGNLGVNQQNAATNAQQVQNQFAIGMGGIQNEAFANETDRMTGMGNLGVNQMNAQTNAQQVQNQFRIQSEANAIEQMRVSGQISNEQAANEIERLRQQSQHEIGMGNLGVNQGQLALGQQTLSLLDQFRNRELAQTAALEREQMENQMRMAQINAYGRAAKPAASWARSWG